MVEDLFKKEGGNTKLLGSSENVEKDLVHGLLKALYDEYPNYVPLKKLIKYQNILTVFPGITIPSIHRNSENSHKPEFLAEAALVQLTNYIERLDNPEEYRITIKGIELLSTMNLEISSRRLENLSKNLLTLTGLLAVFTFTSILSILYIHYASLVSALDIFVSIFVISIAIIGLGFWVAYYIIKIR